MSLIGNNMIVGVSVTPGIGLEVAQIDYATRTVIKYGTKPLNYNANLREIADLDIFKDALQDLLSELSIPKGTEIVLNIPTVAFKINDYPAAMDGSQIENAIEEELYDHPLFKTTEPTFSATTLPASSMQFNKIAYTAAQKSTLIEVVLFIKDLGYKVRAIDTSVCSVFNSLVYLNRVNIEYDSSWLLLVIEDSCCRILSMIGRNFIDVYEEKLSIGEVLGDAENYTTVISTIEPILKNLPSKYLCVVSKTNVISAEVLANKLSYSAPITYQEANSYLKEPLLNIEPTVDPELAKIISLDVIGASIYVNSERESTCRLNLFNRMLGDIYLSEQPPEIMFLGRTIVLSNSKLISLFIVFLIFMALLFGLITIVLGGKINALKAEESDIDTQIAQIDRYLEENKNISSELFDEGDEIRMGLNHNKNIYSYYTIVGTEIPKKLWLTHLKLGNKTTIEGQADNLESVYSFFRSIKDYDPESDIKLQKLGLATSGNKMLNGSGDFDTESLLTSLNADFYEFKISNEPEQQSAPQKSQDNGGAQGLPELDLIN